jgi:replicative DNA helicase
MDSNKIRGYLSDYVGRITEKSKGAMYKCPLCGSGSGNHATGAFSIKDGVNWKCFSCGEYGDIFDLYGKINNKLNFEEQYKGLSELYNISENQNPHKIEHKQLSTQTLAEAVDQTEFFLQAQENLHKTNYPQNRGISPETAERFGLGYVEHWKHPKAPTAPTSPRLIIPTSPYSYLARDVREDIPEEQKPYSKSKVGGVHIFNEQALYNTDKPIFIVEGEIDAISIEEVGGRALGLGSVSNTRKLLNLCEIKSPTQPLIIAMDNDKAGMEAECTLLDGCRSLNLPCFVARPYGKYKDANEALQSDREAFLAAIRDAERLPFKEEDEQRENYLKTSTANYIQSFLNGIADSVNTPYIPTGFKKLDASLDGGLYEGLYIVGAISSLGKTTLVSQIADQIAKNGTHVLIFSLEMARNEIMAKSISRHTIEFGGSQRAKTTRGITTGSRYAGYSKEEKEVILNAVKEYSSYADKIYIKEGMGDIGVKEVRDTVAEHIRFTKKTPIVIIDYLQILAPYNERSTDKQNTDKAVMELKRISRDYKTPVIGISSFNRASYKEAVTMEAFKESGAIEYSSDVLIGLQLKGAGTDGFNATEAKQKDPREIELIVLKNRNGRTGSHINFKFYPKFNYFVETE